MEKVEVKVNGLSKSITDAQGFFNMLLNIKQSYEDQTREADRIKKWRNDSGFSSDQQTYFGSRGIEDTI
ncbi:MAG: hypothetical protein IPL95_05040 [Saprospiraceae bacterium]|nr:hypothetical protein [Saprospiraceae bacterium]